MKLKISLAQLSMKDKKLGKIIRHILDIHRGSLCDEEFNKILLTTLSLSKNVTETLSDADIRRKDAYMLINDAVMRVLNSSEYLWLTGISEYGKDILKMEKSLLTEYDKIYGLEHGSVDEYINGLRELILSHSIY